MKEKELRIIEENDLKADVLVLLKNIAVKKLFFVENI